jgi:hypothetical protein
LRHCLRFLAAAGEIGKAGPKADPKAGPFYQLREISVSVEGREQLSARCRILKLCRSKSIAEICRYSGRMFLLQSLKGLVELFL